MTVQPTAEEKSRQRTATQHAEARARRELRRRHESEIADEIRPIALRALKLLEPDNHGVIKVRVTLADSYEFEDGRSGVLYAWLDIRTH